MSEEKVIDNRDAMNKGNMLKVFLTLLEGENNKESNLDTNYAQGLILSRGYDINSITTKDIDSINLSNEGTPLNRNSDSLVNLVDTIIDNENKIESIPIKTKKKKKI